MALTRPMEPDGWTGALSGVSCRAVLVGNPNVGKSAIFWRLTGKPSEECNIPGSSVAVSMAPVRRGARHRWRRFRRSRLARRVARVLGGGRGGAGGAGGAKHGRGTRSAGLLERPGVEEETGVGPCDPVLIDTPGATSLFPLGEDEMATRDLLLGLPEVVVFVADAKNLRRSLALFLQVAAFERPMVFDLNMVDEAENVGVHVDVAALQERLGCPCNTSVAIEGHGMNRLAAALHEARPASYKVVFQAPIEEALEELSDLLRGGSVPPRALGSLLLARDPRGLAVVEQEFGPGTQRLVREIVDRTEARYGTPLDVVMTEQLHAAAEQLAAGLVHRHPHRSSLSDRVGHLVQSPLTGVPVAIVITMAMYLWVGQLGAGLVVDTIEQKVFDGWLIPLMTPVVDRIPWAFLRGALMDPDFGLLPTGLFLAFGIVLPVLFFFFLFFAVLEDSGYLPRLSILLDRVLRLVGLNGKGVLPLVMGFSCVTMAVITTRMLDTRKERLIATFLLILGIPCAPLLSVQILILRDLSWTAPVTVYGIILLQILVAGVAANRVLGGRLPDFIMEIPRMRLPKPRVVLARTWRRSVQFTKEAVPVFMLASFIMYVLNWMGGLDLLEAAGRPVVGHLLGLPDKAIQVLIKTLIRRESGAAELHLVQESFDSVQLVVTLLVMTFLMPCLNAVIVIIKEHGLKAALVIMGGVMVYCVLAGALVNAVCRALGVSFA